MERERGSARLRRDLNVFVLLIICGSCTSTLNDPYRKNPNERDPRARVLDYRKALGPDSAKVAEEFKAMRRPIIERYVTYRATISEERDGRARSYTHIVLTDEACAMINVHTFQELVVALFPLTQDEYWSGDAMALLSTAAWSPATAGLDLSRANYHSPEDPGVWPQRWKSVAKAYSIGREGTREYIRGGHLLNKSAGDLEVDQKNVAALRRAGLWPKDDKTD